MKKMAKSDGLSKVENELRRIRQDMKTKFGEIDGRFDEVNTKFDEVNTKFDEVNTKLDKLADNMDWLVGEYKKNDEERVIMSDHLRDHGDRIEELEKAAFKTS